MNVCDEIMSSEPQLIVDDPTSPAHDAESVHRFRASNEDIQLLTEMSALVGRKWHLAIVTELLEQGPMGFSALGDDLGSISDKVLSESLKDLEEKGLVDWSVISTRPYRVEYSLTGSGRALEPVIQAMREWGRTHLTRT